MILMITDLKYLAIMNAIGYVSLNVGVIAQAIELIIVTLSYADR